MKGTQNVYWILGILTKYKILTYGLVLKMSSSSSKVFNAQCCQYVYMSSLLV